MILPSGYSNEPFDESCCPIARIRVNGPIRPENINMETQSFPAADRKGVIPNERPTVPEAEITSKKIPKKL